MEVNNKERAAIHTIDMEKRYGDKINFSVKNSVIYGGDSRLPQKSTNLCNTELLILNESSTEAVLQYPKAILLNFASYRHAGGGFIKGAWAQEEAICHDSTLYNVLCHFESYYAWNNTNLNRSLYTDRAIFSPGIVFMHGSKTEECDVITCAAPNYGSAVKHGVTKLENEEALRQRIDFVISIAEEQDNTTVILGAWGCGVFRQEPSIVAKMFEERLKKSSLKRAVFAVPGQNRNYTEFKDIYK